MRLGIGYIPQKPGGPSTLRRCRQGSAYGLTVDQPSVGPVLPPSGSIEIDLVRAGLYNSVCIPRVDPLIGGGVAEWLKAAVC